MKVSLETKVLKDLVARVMKGVGNNDSVMRTCWIGIKCQDNVLYMTSWDGENYLQVSQDKVVCENFKVTVIANTFSQLISKTTSENVTLELQDKYLEVKGNGKYKLELPVNEDGELDVYPEITFDSKGIKPFKVKLSSVVWVVAGNKISLAKTPEIPQLMCYYMGDNVFTTDNIVATKADLDVFKTPLLLKSDLVDLIATMENEEINTFIKGNRILLETPYTKILGYCNEGKEEFESDTLPALTSLFENSYPSSCSVDKSELLGILDRILLFVKTKEEAIRVMFTEKGIQFYNKDNSVNELLVYKTSDNFQPCEVMLQLDILKQLITNQDDELFIHYGDKGSIKLGKDKRQHLLATLEEA